MRGPGPIGAFRLHMSQDLEGFVELVVTFTHGLPQREMTEPVRHNAGLRFREA